MMVHQAAQPSNPLLERLKCRGFSKFQDFSDEMMTEFEKQKTAGNIRDYQLNAVLEVKKMFDQDQVHAEENPKRQKVPLEPAIVVAPTGSGKTGMIVMLPYVLQSRKVLIIAPTMEIRGQIQQAFGDTKGKPDFLETAGILSDVKDDVIKRENLIKLRETVRLIEKQEDINHCEGAGVVIVNAQKFQRNAILGYASLDDDGIEKIVNKVKKRRINKSGNVKPRKEKTAEEKEEKRANILTIVDDTKSFFQEFDTLIVDEAHHYPAQTWADIIEQFTGTNDTNKKLIFLTATPYKKGTRKCKKFIEGPNGSLERRVVYKVTREELEGKFIRTREFVAKTKYNDDVLFRDLEKCFTNCRKKDDRYEPKAMVLVRTVKEVERLVTFLNKAARKGIPAKDNVRKQYAIAAIGKHKKSLEKFRQSKYSVAISCNKGMEGYDNDDVVICVILRKIKSTLLFEQFIGRCVRMKQKLKDGPDRNTGVVLSYLDFDQKTNWENLEYVSDKDPADSVKAEAEAEADVEADAEANEEN